MTKIKAMCCLPLILGFKPSYACACSEAPSVGEIVLSISIATLGLILACLPIWYFFLKIKTFESSVWALIVPIFIAVAIIFGLFALGFERSYIHLPIIDKNVSYHTVAIIGTILVILLWLYPAIYTYRRGKWYRSLYHPLRK